MSLLQRAATLAAVTLALAGIAGLSAPGQAAVLQASQLVTAPLSGEPTPAVLTDAAPAFQTLDAAIAANDQGQGDAGAAADAVTAEATRCLAAAIYFEAKGEPAEGQLAVAEVIINRARSGRFPEDVCGVVTQRGQFSFVHGGAIPHVEDARPGYRTAIAVAKVAMASAWQSSAPEALYFHAKREPMSGRVTRIAAIGNHVFYR